MNQINEINQINQMEQNIAFIKIIQKRLQLKEDLHLLQKTEYWSKIYSINDIGSIFQENPERTIEQKALTVNFEIKYFFYEYIYKLLYFRLIPYFISKKYHFWNKMFENIFISDEFKEQIWQIFYDIQKIYYGFSRMATIYKFKKATIKINSDLYMNELTSEQKNVYTLIQNNSKYLFTVMDLSHIITAALSNLSYFFISILEIKNPYNNVVINNATLYNIYFFIKQNHFIMPTLFENFFLCNFDSYKFEREHESLIKSIGIENYAFKSPHNCLYEDIRYMFRVNREYTSKLSIHKDFPRDILINIFRPYLHLYYIHKYYIIGTVKQRDASICLYRKLTEFVLYNPFFGRKIIKREVKYADFKKSIVQTESFNTNHILFNNPKKMSQPTSVDITIILSGIFMNNHLDEEFEIVGIHTSIPDTEVDDESVDNSEPENNEDTTQTGDIQTGYAQTGDNIWGDIQLGDTQTGDTQNEENID